MNFPRGFAMIAAVLFGMDAGCIAAPSLSGGGMTIISCPAPAPQNVVGVPIRLWGSASAVSQRYGDPAMMELTCTFLESTPGAGDGLYDAFGSYSTPGAGGFAIPTKTARVEPGKRYVIDAWGDYVNYFALNVAVPAGYQVEMEGVYKRKYEATGIGPFYSGTIAFTVTKIEIGAASSGRAGVASQIDTNIPHWSVALGSLLNGDSAGALSIIESGTYSSWSSLFTPATLQYDTTSSEVQVYRVSGVIRQILAVQAAVDVVTINSTTYELRFYNPGQVTGSTFPRGFTGEPYVLYEVTQGSTSTTLKITSKTRNLSSLTSTGNSIVRTAVTTLARTGSWPTFDWTRSDWNTSGAAQVAEQFSDGSGTASARVENLEIRPPGQTAAVKVQRNFSLFGWGEQLTTETFGTSNTTATTRDYYNDSGQPGSYGFLKSVTETGGNWTAYEYWNSGSVGTSTGQIKYKYRPWGGSPSSVTFNAALGEVTYFEYTTDPFGINSRPSLVETRVNNTLTGKSTTTYTNVSGTINGMNVVEAVRKDYSDASNYLTITTRFYREDTSDAFWRGAVHSVFQPGNLKTSFLRQRGTWNGSSFTKSGTAGTGAGTASKIAVISGTTATGTLRQTEDGYDIEDLYLVTGQSTMEVTIRDSRALVVRTESHVWNGSAWALIAWANNTFNYAGLLTQTTTSNGAVRDASWNGEQLASGTDETGVVVGYTYTDAGRVFEAAKVNGPTTEFTYDAAGNVKQEKLKRTGTSETITVARAFDDAGRQTSQTPPGLSAVTFGYNPSARTRTTTNPDGGTRIETYLLDGRLEKVTGTAIIEQFYSYSIETDGRRKTQVNTGSVSSPRWSKAWTDWLGRTIQEDVPIWNSSSAATRVHTYDSAGRLWKTTQPGLAPTLRTYDSMGNLATEGLDIDGTANSLDASSNDRITVYSTSIYDSGSGTWWLKQTTSTYPISSDPTLKELGRTETKLTNLATGRLSQVESYDIYGNKTVSYTTVDRNNKTAYAYVDTPDSTTDAYQKSVNGLMVESRDTAGVTFTFGYDLLDRPSTSTDPRTSGVTTTYYVSNSARVSSVWIPGSIMQAQYDYDTMGRVWRQQDTLGKYAYTSYTLKGQVYRQWGDTTVPVEYVYDTTYGQQSKLKTFRGGSGWANSTWPSGSEGTIDFTKWEYDEGTGLLNYKYDAANLNASGEPIASPKRVAYTYNSAGQLKTRTWARGAATTYYYFGESGGEPVTGELRKVDYADTGMTDLEYTYKRFGATYEATDVTGKRTFNYNLGGTPTMELQSEDLTNWFGSGPRRITWPVSTSGVLGRPTGLQFGTSGSPSAEQSVAYTYQGDGRLSTITANSPGFSTPAFTYTYATNSHLIASTVNTTLGYTDVRTYDGAHDWLDVRETKWGGTIEANFAYTQDNIGRTTEVAKTGEMFNRYGTGNAGLTTYYTYTDKSELKSEVTKLGTVNPTVVLTGRNDSLYEYDPIGNRKKVTHNGRDFNFTTNSRNGYDQRSMPGYFDVAGFDTATQQVTVSKQGNPPINTATRHGDYFFNDYPLTNDPNPAYATLRVSGTTTVDFPAFVASLAEPFSYDDDGNLLTDSRWDYTYDSENRLIAMQTNTSVIPNADKRRLEFTYDYLGRRVRKIVRAGYNGSSYTTEVSDTKFIYNGWNCIATLNANNSEALVASYFWGMDIAGRGQRAGGIGGLLMIQKQSDYAYIPAYDAMGNVHALIRTNDGSLAACYEYDAFGNTLRESGTYAASNPFRFSTKFTDSDTGLVYFGYRYYSPFLGRFINQDPANGTRGSGSLYNFVNNAVPNAVDLLGLYPVEWINGDNGYYLAIVHVYYNINRSAYDPYLLLNASAAAWTGRSSAGDHLIVLMQWATQQEYLSGNAYAVNVYHSRELNPYGTSQSYVHPSIDRSGVTHYELNLYGDWPMGSNHELGHVLGLDLEGYQYKWQNEAGEVTYSITPQQNQILRDLGWEYVDTVEANGFGADSVMFKDGNPPSPEDRNRLIEKNVATNTSRNGGRRLFSPIPISSETVFHVTLGINTGNAVTATFYRAISHGYDSYFGEYLVPRYGVGEAVRRAGMDQQAMLGRAILAGNVLGEYGFLATDIGPLPPGLWIARAKFHAGDMWGAYDAIGSYESAAWLKTIYREVPK